jgi:hypothetical protein
VALLNPDYDMKHHDVLYVSIKIIAAVFLFAISASIPSELTLDRNIAVTDVYAQPYV